MPCSCSDNLSVISCIIQKASKIIFCEISFIFNAWLCDFCCISAVSVNLLFGIEVRYIPAGVSACLRQVTHHMSIEFS